MIRLAPHARSVLDTLLPQDLEAGALARLFHGALGTPEHEFETVHFADFTVAFLGEWYATLSRYRCDLPTPDMLRHAA